MPKAPAAKQLRIRIIEDGDHSFAVRKRSGRTDDDAMREVATALSDWSSAECA